MESEVVRRRAVGCIDWLDDMASTEPIYYSTRLGDADLIILWRDELTKHRRKLSTPSDSLERERKIILVWVSCVQIDGVLRHICSIDDGPDLVWAIKRCSLLLNTAQRGEKRRNVVGAVTTTRQAMPVDVRVPKIIPWSQTRDLKSVGRSPDARVIAARTAKFRTALSHSGNVI